jgi:hypothetical protein
MKWGQRHPIKYWIVGNEVEDPGQFEGTGRDYAEALKAKLRDDKGSGS